jgi:hypothetical protein
MVVMTAVGALVVYGVTSGELEGAIYVLTDDMAWRYTYIIVLVI